MAWEPWTGCYKKSDGCTYCYYYGPYSKRFGQNTIVKTDEFYKPIETIFMPRKKITKYKIESGKNINTCFTTDFFLPESDEWRGEVWSMMKQRPDLTFTLLTKRIERFHVSLPEDWGDGYDNVRIGCTVENQETADFRLPLYVSYPIKNRFIVCSPLLKQLQVNIVKINNRYLFDSVRCIGIQNLPKMWRVFLLSKGLFRLNRNRLFFYEETPDHLSFIKASLFRMSVSTAKRC